MATIIKLELAPLKVKVALILLLLTARDRGRFVTGTVGQMMN